MGETSLPIPFPFKRTAEAGQGFCGELLVCFSVSPGRWLADMDAPGLLLGLPGAAVGGGVALSLRVLCWPGARELCGPDFVVVLTFLC